MNLCVYVPTNLRMNTCMNLFIYICLYVYNYIIFVCLFLYAYMNLSMCRCMCEFIYIYMMYACTHIFMNSWIYDGMYEFLFACMF